MQMRSTLCVIAIGIASWVGLVRAQDPAAPAFRPFPGSQPDPIVKGLVDRLDLEKYKATIKGLTQFGDRRQGTDRNRAALDWIEAQLKSGGCTKTERLTYEYNPPAPTPRPARAQ